MGSGERAETARELLGLVSQAFERAAPVVGEEGGQVLAGQLAQIDEGGKGILQRPRKRNVLRGGLPQHFGSAGDLRNRINAGPMVGDDVH